jgi:hypothetical protein
MPLLREQLHGKGKPQGHQPHRQRLEENGLMHPER